MTFLKEIAEGGYAVVPDLLNAEITAALTVAVEQLSAERFAAGRGGVRNILDLSPEILAVSRRNACAI